jgi:hypothetical protein
VSGPSWLTAAFAALMLLIAASCVARLGMWRLRNRVGDPQADVLHVLMGVAMAGMLEPRISPVPDTVWRGVFVLGAVWFAWLAIRARGQRRFAGPRCAHPAPHAVECAAMLYMLLPSHAAMAMPRMAGSGASANPALALVLALFMLGYLVWTADQLARLSRARTAGPSGGPGLAGRGALVQEPAAGAVPLAPRFAACYKIAMSVAMGYMLLTML